jgi:general stress protein CsbA
MKGIFIECFCIISCPSVAELVIKHKAVSGVQRASGIERVCVVCLILFPYATQKAFVAHQLKKYIFFSYFYKSFLNSWWLMTFCLTSLYAQPAWTLNVFSPCTPCSKASVRKCLSREQRCKENPLHKGKANVKLSRSHLSSFLISSFICDGRPKFLHNL